MPLHRWKGRHIALMWLVGLVALWLVGQTVSHFSGPSHTGGLSSVSVPVLPLLVALLVVIGLLVVTLAWVRRQPPRTDEFNARKA